MLPTASNCQFNSFKANSIALEDETIDDCECEQLRGEFISLREEYQLLHGQAYDNYRVGIEEAIKSEPCAVLRR
jgi:hypothetical protein